MLNPRIFRRSFSLLRRGQARQLVHSGAREGHGGIRIQRVRFVKHRWTLGERFRRANRFVTGILVMYFGIRTYLRYGVDDEETSQWDLVGPAQSRPGSSGTVSQNEEEDEMEPIFIPTGWPRRKEFKIYQPSDPEWNLFMNVSKDEEYLSRVKDALSLAIARYLENLPAFEKRLGKINNSSYLFWERFPRGPSPEYECPGIEIDGDLNVAWTRRPVSDEDNHRFNRIVFPTPVAAAFYSSVKDHIRRTMDEVKSLIFPSDEQETSKQNTKTPKPSNEPQNSWAANTAIRSGAGASNPPTSSSPHTSGSTAIPATPKKPVITIKLSPTQSDSTSADASGFEMDIKTLDLRTFKQTLIKNWKPALPPLPPGTFLVGGIYEARAEKGKLRCDVIAVFDPKTGHFNTIQLQIFQMFNV